MDYNNTIIMTMAITESLNKSTKMPQSVAYFLIILFVLIIIYCIYLYIKNKISDYKVSKELEKKIEKYKERWNDK